MIPPPPPTGQREPPRSGSGIPDRFNRKPLKPDEFKFQIKIRSLVGLVRYTSPVRPVPGHLKKSY
jgi:hypothetical protein